jgi:hypothetical protein
MKGDKMTKDQIKPKDVRAFLFTQKGGPEGNKEFFVGYDSRKNLVGLAGPDKVIDFVDDLINHVKIKNWKKDTSNFKSKGEKWKWSMTLYGHDGGEINFTGECGYDPKEFEDGEDRWKILMQLIDIVETRQREERTEEAK